MSDKYADLPDDIANPPMFYDYDGNPIGLRTWTRLFSETDRQIARTEVELPGGDKALVSTVWLGIDMALPCGPPLTFETMIFWETGNYASDDYQVRSSTRIQALADHDQAVEHARNLGLIPEHSHDHS